MKWPQTWNLRRKMIHGLIFLLGMSLISSGLAVFPTYSKGLGLAFVVGGLVVFVTGAVMVDACAAQSHLENQCKPPKYEVVVSEDPEAARACVREKTPRVSEECLSPRTASSWIGAAHSAWTACPCDLSSRCLLEHCLETASAGTEDIPQRWWYSHELQCSNPKAYKDNTFETVADIHGAATPRPNPRLFVEAADRSNTFMTEGKSLLECEACARQRSRYAQVADVSCDEHKAHPLPVSRTCPDGSVNAGKEKCENGIGDLKRNLAPAPPSYEAVLAGDVLVLATLGASQERASL